MVRRERFANNTADSLSGAINSSVTSFTLNDGSSFPSEGDFRILVNSELMLVTARATDTLTVVRGIESTTPASHSLNDVVTIVTTDAAFEKYQRDSDPWSITRPPYRIVDTNGDALTKSDFTEVNFTDNAVSSDAGGNITITKDDHTGASLSMLVRTAPTAPYVITGAMTALQIADGTGSGPLMGFVMRESGTSKILFLALQPANTLAKGYKVLSHANATTAAGIKLEIKPIPYTNPMWFRIEDDNTNVKFSFSQDGVNFPLFFEELRGAFFTTAPNQVGFCLNNVNGVDDNYASLVAWDGE